MALRRSCDVNDIRSGFVEKPREVAEVLFDRKPLEKLARHQRFAVAHPNNLASLNSLNLGSVRVCDLPASNDGDLKHYALRSRQLSKKRLSPSSVETFGVQPTLIFKFLVTVTRPFPVRVPPSPVERGWQLFLRPARIFFPQIAKRVSS